MFKKGDIVRRKDSYNPAYATGTVIRTYHSDGGNEVADVRWVNHQYQAIETWYISSLVSDNDPVELLKDII